MKDNPNSANHSGYLVARGKRSRSDHAAASNARKRLKLNVSSETFSDQYLPLVGPHLNNMSIGVADSLECSPISPHSSRLCVPHDPLLHAQDLVQYCRTRHLHAPSRDSRLALIESLHAVIDTIIPDSDWAKLISLDLEVVELYRASIEQESSNYRPEFAFSLTRAIHTCYKLKMWDEALLLAEEAIRLYHNVCLSHAQEFNGPLSLALMDFSRFLSQFAPEKLVEPGKNKADRHIRKLVAQHLSELGQLAGALSKSATALRALNHTEAARRLDTGSVQLCTLSPAHVEKGRAVRVFRDILFPEVLYRDAPHGVPSRDSLRVQISQFQGTHQLDVYDMLYSGQSLPHDHQSFIDLLVGFTMALGNTSSPVVQYTEDELLVPIYRYLSNVQPELYMPRLAHSLSITIYTRYRPSEMQLALYPLIKEATIIYGELFDEDRHGHRLSYTRLLSMAIRHIGLEEESQQKYIRIALGLYRTLDAQQHGVLHPDINSALFVMPGFSNPRIIGEIPQLLFTTLHHLSAHYPRYYGASLGTSLIRRAKSTEQSKQWVRAQTFYEEAIPIFRHLHAEVSAACWRDLADSLEGAGRCSRFMNKWGRSRELNEEALDLYPDDGGHRKKRAACLCDISLAYLDAGEPQKAYEAREKAMATGIKHTPEYELLWKKFKTSYEASRRSALAAVAIAAEVAVPIKGRQPSLFDALDITPTEVLKDTAPTMVDIDWSDSAPVTHGGYSSIFRARWQGQLVALKQLKPHPRHDKVLKRIGREAWIWQQQSHPNVLRLLGVFSRTSEKSTLFYLVSVWQPFGHVHEYLQKYPSANREILLLGIAEGLAYLHKNQPAIVHGDLRGANILVSDEHVPVLSDFGLSHVVDDIQQEYPGMMSMDTSTHNRGGAIRWMAPELLDGGGDGDHRPPLTKSTDVYSLAMVIIEVYSGNVPFPNLNDFAVFRVLAGGKRPPRPETMKLDEVWELTMRCWDAQCEIRPPASEVVSILKSLV